MTNYNINVYLKCLLITFNVKYAHYYHNVCTVLAMMYRKNRILTFVSRLFHILFIFTIYNYRYKHNAKFK